MAVTDERWQAAQRSEMDFWSAEGFLFASFCAVIEPSMWTAAWAAPHLAAPVGDWLEIGVGPLGVGCMHFLPRAGELHTLDPLKPVSVDRWQIPEPCKALARRCQEETSVAHVSRAESIDLPDGAFSVVALHNVLDHVQDPAAVLREVRRVLKPGGQLLLAVDTFSALGRLKFQLITRRVARDSILVRAHPRRLSAGAVRRLVAGAGFRVLQADPPTRIVAAVGQSYRLRLIAATVQLDV